MATSLTTNGLVIAASASLSSDVNTMDDYQEGTHTSTFIHSGSTYSYADQIGHYVKVGKNVFYSSYTGLNGSGSSFSGTSATISVGGLPFTVLNSTNYFGHTTVAYVYKFYWTHTTSGNQTGGDIIFAPRLEPNQTYGGLMTAVSGGLSYTMDGNDCIAQGARLQHGGWYITAS